MSIKYPPNEEKVDRRILRTRRLLRTALVELMEELDFHQITVQDITDRAMINRTTFYTHFEDKYALLYYIGREMFKEALVANIPQPASLTLDNVRLLLVTVCEFLWRFYDHCAPSQRSDPLPIETQVQEQVYQLFWGWIHDLDLSAEHNPQIVATVLSWAVFGSALQWARDKERLDLDNYVDQVMPMLVNGIQPLLV